MSVEYFDQLLGAVCQVHVVYLAQLMGAVIFMHFISNHDNAKKQNLERKETILFRFNVALIKIVLLLNFVTCIVGC